MPTLTVHARVPGRPEPADPDWNLSWPDDSGPGDPETLRTLITRLVRQGVAEYRTRQDRRPLLRVLTPEQIEAGIARGRVECGGREPGPVVDEEAAVGAALQAFEDGLYLAILDGVELRALDQQVWLQPSSRLTFLRLTFLAGA